ncbi:hypothetical protein [Aquimarina sp. SS2-1]|uniref:hypothetical protein n=1 Tax=Aquimarina besae TaxID=3342247 RepID=UPI00367311EC
MKLDLKKFYVVYKPKAISEKVDVFSGYPNDINGLLNQFRGGLKTDMIYGVYSSKTSAQKDADALWNKHLKNRKEKKKISQLSNKERFKDFVAQLEVISSKTGIAIQTIGGVLIFDGPEEITYDNDHTSGDLIPKWKDNFNIR